MDNTKMYATVVGGFYNKLERDLTESLTTDIDLASRLTLKRQPDNKYDKNAIAVYFDNHIVGHIKRETAAELAPMLDDKFDAKVIGLDESVASVLNELSVKRFFPHMTLHLELVEKTALWDSLTDVVKKFK